jgi:hypothetical protein
MSRKVITGGDVREDLPGGAAHLLRRRDDGLDVSGSDSEKLPAAPILHVAILYLIAIIPRLLAIAFPPARFVYNPDELDLLRSALDRFIGIPTVVPMEPSTVPQILHLPVVIADFLFHAGLPHTSADFLGRFSQYLAATYMDPRHSLALMRVTVAVLSSAGPVLAYLVARRLSRSAVMGWACAILLSFNPVFFRQSVMAAGDAIAVMFVLASATALLLDSPRVGFSGAFLGCAVASKYVVAPLVILPLVVIGLTSGREGLSRVAKFVGSAALAFFLLVPWIWVDAIRSAKSLYGSVNKLGSTFDAAAFWSLFRSANGPEIVCVLFAVPGLVWGLRRIRHPDRRAWLVAAGIAMTLVTLLIARHATTAFPRYYLSQWPPVIVVISAISWPMRERRRIAFAAALGIIALASIGDVARREAAERKPDPLIQALAEVPRLPATAEVHLPDEVLNTFRYAFPRSYYERAADRGATLAVRGAGTTEFLKLHGIGNMSAAILRPAFNEDEQADAAHYAAIASIAPARAPDAFVYYDEATENSIFAVRNAGIDETLTHALETAANRAVAILVPHAEPRLGSPLWQNGQWYWYVTRGDKLK